MASVSDVAAVTLLLDCCVAEIPQHFETLSLELPEPPSESFDTVDILCEEYYDTGILEFYFTARIQAEHWAKPWSIADFVSMLASVVEEHSIPGLRYIQAGDPILDGVTFEIKLHTPEGTVRQVLERWVPIIRDICDETNARLTANVRKGSLVALFNFAPEVKTACEQYLLYFVQFLEDLSIRATANLEEQARGVLFTVTPQSGPEALERIREALDLYLQIPGSPDFDAEVTRHRDVAVQQLAANVLHWRSQLMLTQAILETKNATIEALQAANLQYRQLLSTNPQNQGQLPGPRADDAQKDEPILGDTVILTKTNWKWGIQLDLASIFRKLKRSGN
jgi:hypothetical protein